MTTSVQMGIGVVFEFQNWQIGIEIVFVWHEVSANYSQLPKLLFLFIVPSYFFLFLTRIYFLSVKTYLAHKILGVRFLYYTCILNIEIKGSWMFWKAFVNGNNFCVIILFYNRNNIHKIKMWRRGIEIYLWLAYQQLDWWQIYSWIIGKLLMNRELFA